MMAGGLLRGGFRRELARLDGRVLDLGRDVEGSLALLAEVLEDHDVAVAERKVGYDRHLKIWGEEIEDDCMLLQARQAPVARDLRHVHTARAISGHAVRAGTLCEHAFRAAIEVGAGRGAEGIERAMVEMARRSHELFRAGLQTFERRDIGRVRELRDADDGVDLLCAEVMRLAAADKDGKVPVSPWFPAQAALIAHYLERIADHGVDIGLRTAFLIKGEAA